MKTIRIITITLLALALPLLDIVTFRHTYDFKGDMGPEFYGLPFIYRTEIPWGSSLSGEFYVLGYFGNVLFCAIVVLIFTLLMMRIKLNLTIKKLWNISWTSTSIVLILFSALFFFITDWRFDWTNSEILQYTDQSVDCSKTLEFISVGK